MLGFRNIPREHRRAVVANLLRTFDERTTRGFLNHSKAQKIVDSFVWMMTPQGHDYFKQVFNQSGPQQR